MSENDRILIGRYKMPYTAKRGYRELLERELTAWNQKSYKTIGSVINSCMTQKVTYLSPPAPDVFESGGQFYERVVVVTSSVPYRDIEVLAPRDRVTEYVNIATPPSSRNEIYRNVRHPR